VLQSGTIPGNSTFLRGTPVLAGLFTFTVTAKASNGASFSKTYTFYVVQITTTSLPAYTVGTPYSVQLHATGGSNNFTWNIISGTLPDGLVMDPTGLIHGTPIAAIGSSTIVFVVSDTTCEAVTKREFTPRARLQTSGLTTISTRRGFAEFTGGFGTLYKKATYTGFLTQIAFPNYNSGNIDATQCAGAKFIYSGFDEINAFGNILNHHSKNLFKMCLAGDPSLLYAQIIPGSFPAQFVPLIIINTTSLLGYCWDTDGNSCEDCNTDETTWSLFGDVYGFGVDDSPRGVFGGGGTADITALTRRIHGSLNQSGPFFLSPSPDTFPVNNGLGVYYVQLAFVRFQSVWDWTVTLSDEFTPADEASQTQIFHNSLKIAENSPDFFRFSNRGYWNIQSRTTSVTYTVQCSNLVAGRNYRVRVGLQSSTGTITYQTIDFTATGTTDSVTGNVPVPPSGTRVLVLDPTITFA
jgi:hypothetical protein